VRVVIQSGHSPRLTLEAVVESGARNLDRDITV
jgi:hypothetical protein